jgi:hypothetical protein
MPLILKSVESHFILQPSCFRFMNKEKIKGTNHGIWKNLYKNLGGCYYLFRMQTLSIQLCKREIARLSPSL